MSLVDWRRRQDRIEEVFVPESALAEGESPAYARMYVSYCVRHALNEAMYLRDELPREAVIVAALAKYLGDVNNGGHGQFVGNTGWSEEHRADIREGLAILGQHEALRIFEDLETFAVRHPKRFACNAGEAHEIDPYFYELDDRFAQVGRAAEVALVAWIRTRSWLRIMPDEEYFRMPAWKTPNHTSRDARIEERRRMNEPNARRGLLVLHAGLQAHRAKGWKRLWRRLVKAWHSRGL